jgi:ubiquinone biosynthesis protein UbiJ
MYGDTGAVRAWARRLRALAAEIDRDSDDVLARAEGVAWSGVAADAMRASARRLAGELRTCAARHRAAADALDRHAAEVERVQAAIAAIEHRAERVLAHAAAGGRDAVHWASTFTAPARGSVAWLDVHVPDLW